MALICLLKPLTRTAQKVVPHGGCCHITLKLGMNYGNPGCKASSWQEGRQASANREAECLQKSLLLSPTAAGRPVTCGILAQLARSSSCPETRPAGYWYLLVLLVLSVVKDMETFSFSPWLVGLVESCNWKHSSCFPVVTLSHISSWYSECSAY